MFYNIIKDPILNKFENINEKRGKSILNRYIKFLYRGGSDTKSATTGKAEKETTLVTPESIDSKEKLRVELNDLKLSVLVNRAHDLKVDEIQLENAQDGHRDTVKDSIIELILAKTVFSDPSSSLLLDPLDHYNIWVKKLFLSYFPSISDEMSLFQKEKKNNILCINYINYIQEKNYDLFQAELKYRYSVVYKNKYREEIKKYNEYVNKKKEKKKKEEKKKKKKQKQ